MRHFILAICCVAATALVPDAAYAQSSGLVAQEIFKQRPPPSTEPSIVVAENPPRRR